MFSPSRIVSLYVICSHQTKHPLHDIVLKGLSSCQIHIDTKKSKTIMIFIFIITKENNYLHPTSNIIQGEKQIYTPLHLSSMS